jgi:hypothetical protein
MELRQNPQRPENLIPSSQRSVAGERPRTFLINDGKRSLLFCSALPRRARPAMVLARHDANTLKCIDTLGTKSAQRTFSYRHMTDQELHGSELIAQIKGKANGMRYQPRARHIQTRRPSRICLELRSLRSSPYILCGQKKWSPPGQTHIPFSTRSCFPEERLSTSRLDSSPTCHDGDCARSPVYSCYCHPHGSGEIELCLMCRGR